MRVWLSWICYWLGDAVSRPLHWFGDSWANGVAVNVCWRPYQKLMAWSCDLQGERPDGPWYPPANEEKG